jgi:hypothetical protein
VFIFYITTDLMSLISETKVSDGDKVVAGSCYQRFSALILSANYLAPLLIRVAYK